MREVPEEKELVETIIWIVLSWSLLRTTAKSLNFNVIKMIIIQMMKKMTKTLRSSEVQSRSQQQLTLQDCRVRSQLQKLEDA